MSKSCELSGSLNETILSQASPTRRCNDYPKGVESSDSKRRTPKINGWFVGEVCRNCGSNRRKKHAKGLCKKCYKEQWYSDNPEAKYTHYRKNYLKNREVRIIASEANYIINREAILNRLQKKYRNDSFNGNMIKALERDNFTCQNPNCEGKSDRLDVHHKDGRGVNSDNPNHSLDSLITWCAVCHGEYDHSELSMGDDIV